MLVPQFPVQLQRFLGRNDGLRKVSAVAVRAGEAVVSLGRREFVAAGLQSLCSCFCDLHGLFHALLTLVSNRADERVQARGLPTFSSVARLDLPEDIQGVLGIRQAVSTFALHQGPVSNRLAHDGCPPSGADLLVQGHGLLGVFDAVLPRGLAIHLCAEEQKVGFCLHSFVLQLLRHGRRLSGVLQGFPRAFGPRRPVALLYEDHGDGHRGPGLQLFIPQVDEDSLGVLDSF
mmetsp:Transcript_134696/g.430296  ORF Transcript_134696/g.430296 Transcript_134696/m.430296 type:complete len:232 (-) Transcript_134696:453-1148(-)